MSPDWSDCCLLPPFPWDLSALATPAQHSQRQRCLLDFQWTSASPWISRTATCACQRHLLDLKWARNKPPTLSSAALCFSRTWDCQTWNNKLQSKLDFTAKPTIGLGG